MTDQPALTIFCHDAPYPPHHGARVDMSRRIEALHALGVRLQIVAWWCDGGSHDALERSLRAVADDVLVLDIARDLPTKIRKSLLLARYPWEEASRWLPPAQVAQVVARVEAFAPDAVLLDGLHGARLALAVCDRLALPLLYRSHNIEYVYARRLYATSRGRQRLRRFFTAWRAEPLETRVIEHAARVYDCSADDMKFWEARGYSHFRWQPPIVRVEALVADGHTPSHDVGFIGNLTMDNNVDGITWFLGDVLPRLTERHGAVRVLIAGRSPVPALQALCESLPDVTLIADPDDVRPLYAQARVFVNPVRQGSGIKVKTLEMLGMGVTFVTTREGASGLPDDIRDQLPIADDADTFAAELHAQLSAADAGTADAVAIPDVFSSQAQSVIIDDIRELSRPAIPGAT